LAEVAGDEILAQHLCDMLAPERQREAVHNLGLDDYLPRVFDAMMRNVSETTILKAGLKSNVMPAEAEATISARSLPGVTETEWLQEIRDVVGDDVELHPGRFAAGLAFDLPDDDPLFAAAQWAIQRRDSDATLLPYLSCGGTDAMYLEPVGTKVIGFTPMQPDPAGHLLELAHAEDERIAVDNLLFGTQVLVDTICRLNGVESPLPI
jgi:acetylornithine deacetylase/succinyl-diaminopimelate desuccinylase-like protein